MNIFKNLKTTVCIVGVIWMVFIANFFIPYDLRYYGIKPRTIEGLWGILTMPFLHGNYAHISANTSMLFILLLVSLSFSRKLTFNAIFIIMILGGFLVWVFGTPNTVHIGASSVIFGLIGFLLFMGIFRRELKAFVFSVVVFLLYGGVLFLLMQNQKGVSWAGHFFGFVAGVVSAFKTRKINK